jgi:hypothetical protein
MKDFDEILFNSISDTLAAVLGVVYRDAIYMDLLTRFSIAKEHLPKRLDILSRVLEENFGLAATKAISKAIAKKLCSELYVEFTNPPDFNLESYVNRVRKALN